MNIDNIMDLSEKSRNALNDVAHLCSGEVEEHIFDMGFYSGYNKAKEKYRFTEEDMRKAIKLSYSKGLAKPNSGRLSDIPNVQNEIIQSLEQPKID